MFLVSHLTYFVYLLYLGNCQDLNISNNFKKIIMKISQELVIILIKNIYLAKQYSA